MAAMSGGPLAAQVLLAAAAGGMSAVGMREAVLASPAIGRWLAEAVEPLRRAGREGYAPTELERRRLAALGTGALLLAGLLIAGPGPAPFGALAGPGAVAWFYRPHPVLGARPIDLLDDPLRYPQVLSAATAARVMTA